MSIGGSSSALGGGMISPEECCTFDPCATGIAMVEHCLTNYGQADPQAVHVTWPGKNDIDSPARFTRRSFEQLATMASRPHATGSRKFLVPNLFDLGKLASLISCGDPVDAKQLSDMSVLLHQPVAGLSARLPNAKIKIAEVCALKRLIDRYPDVLSFTNTTEPCCTSFEVRLSDSTAGSP